MNEKDKFGIVEKLIAEGNGCNGKYLGASKSCNLNCFCNFQADYYNFCYKTELNPDLKEWEIAYHKKGVEVYQKIKNELEELKSELITIEIENKSIDKFFTGEKHE